MKRSFYYVPILLVATSIYSCSRVDIQDISNGIINRNSTVMTKSLGETVGNQDFDISLQMAELFIRSDKTNPRITRVDPYVLDDCTCFYVFNFDKGFKIVSADTRVSPILAESAEENLYLEQVHEGLRVWLEDTGDIIKQIKSNNIDTKEDYSVFWSAFKPEPVEIPQTRSWPTNLDYVWVKTVDYSSTVYSANAHVPHLLLTKWGQYYPWNVNMPITDGQHCLTCCVAVAISQVLYYNFVNNNVPHDFWHSISIASTSPAPSPYYDKKIVTLNKSNYTTYSYRWFFMPQFAAFENTQYVSDLMLDIGERLPVYYGINESVARHDQDYKIINLSLCGISSSHSSYTFSTVEADLVNGKPVIVSAWISPNPGSPGHTWVIDGCDDYTLKNITTETFNYVSIDDLENYPESIICYSNEQMLSMYPYAIDGMQVVNTTYVPVKRLLMNWGYDGQGDDAYYGILDTSSWDYCDVSFNYHRHIHYNISTSQIN